ncbi:MAG: 6,7-dimethyl-8-ribityllumazine synthase [Candidatus Rokubacteria bacterium]|nr:6,7-dimethyl-8-ribityllumazine synthase [Candidatus Rokubacteria bacterium]
MAGRGPKSPVSGARGARRLGIVVGRFNEAISKRLLDGALEALRDRGVPPEAVEVHWVPGAFELPQAALLLARSGRFRALVCLGAVIKGETPHFDHVAREAAAGIRQAAMTTGVPISFGVVTALNEEQARERAGGAVGNRGEEAALAALEMAEWAARHTRTGPGRRGTGTGAGRR